ncbi:gephyrin-like molybdotransferase Glp [Spiribacter vilamensis]|uniref:Molybdopterin molybdenumtransferase n=1 Tax=Spiribacter vilamensis TaxID=531306 RepID=A0A4Q8CZ13_9GAMM|nr:gephyrin-like molybdotransferase Glp [Spiribacter vilamensis]RZU98140.1 molybdopterin molybdochelatase [Spiribacter vilamensis]TVO60959.1 molybdopterin molybdotransferase MoeA [Spiribacter vilamensis]
MTDATHGDPHGSDRSLAAALHDLVTAIEPITGYRRVALRAALGQILAEPLSTPVSVPAHDNSAVDGYALRHADAGHVRLGIVGTAAAGHPYPGEIGPGECVRIMTGAVVPPDADAVVMQERVTIDGDVITPTQWPAAGNNIRRAGEDLQAGDRILDPGRRLTAADLGVIASTGRAELEVRRPLRVAFFSTGDELRGVGEPLGPGDIYDSNRYSLYGMLTNLGVEVLDLGVVKDEPDTLAGALAQAAHEADAIVTSGGVSVGDTDHLPTLLERHGELRFRSIAMKPGRPVTVGRFGTAWYFGLPGNPVSVMTTFTQVATPALRRLAGEAPRPARRLSVTTRSALGKKPGRQDFQRGRLVEGADGTLEVVSAGHQGSGVLRSMSEADCFIVLPVERGDVEAGEIVEVEPFTAPLVV